MKTCNECHINKPFSDFSKNKRLNDGYCGMCRYCDSLRQRKHRSATKAVEYRRHWRYENNSKVRTHLKVQYWLKRGVIKKENCFFCSDADTETHHLLYSFPLRVIWVCRKHHRELDRVKNK